MKLAHPITGATLQFEAPLPADCRDFVEALRAQRECSEGAAETRPDAARPE